MRQDLLDMAETAPSSLDARAFLREVFEGRWVFEDRVWRDGARVYRFGPGDGGPLKQEALRALCLVARGASNDQAGYVLGVGPAAMSSKLTLLCDRMHARALDIVAFGPLLESVVLESVEAR